MIDHQPPLRLLLLTKTFHVKIQGRGEGRRLHTTGDGLRAVSDLTEMVSDLAASSLCRVEKVWIRDWTSFPNGLTHRYQQTSPVGDTNVWILTKTEGAECSTPEPSPLPRGGRLTDLGIYQKNVKFPQVQNDDIFKKGSKCRESELWKCCNLGFFFL